MEWPVPIVTLRIFYNKKNMKFDENYILYSYRRKGPQTDH